MADDRSGEMFGPYQLQMLLGRGGMGEVYRALDTEKDRIVAVKLLPPRLAKDPSYQARFRREALTAARVQNPHIVPIHTFGAIDDVLYIEMAFIDGHDLKSRIQSGGPMDPQEAVSVVTQIAGALDAAHAAHLVHRDVKPANILLAGDHAYLSDFGIASSTADTRLTTAGGAIGSFAYMAPERFDDDQPLTGAVDIYALGCVLYECLTGAPPFRGGSQRSLIDAHMQQPPPPMSQLRPGLPSALDDVIGYALAKRPSERYPTAKAFAQAAQHTLTGQYGPPSSAATGGAGGAAGGAGAHALATGPGGVPPQAGSWKRWIIPLLVAAVSVGLIGALLGPKVFGSDDNNAQAVQLIPADKTQPEVFTGSVVTDKPSDTVKQPHVRQDGPAGGATNTAASGDFDPQSTTGDQAGLYGREGDKVSCDSERLISLIMAKPSVAKAWAQLQGIRVDQISATIKSFTSVVLRADTYVTNTIYKNGKPESYPAVLQAGTAVLVDQYGMPRTKCNCGNPLLAPPSGNDRKVVGTAWAGYSPSRIRLIEKTAKALSNYKIQDVATGAARTLSAGSAAKPPADVTPATLQTAQVPAACQATAQRLVGGKAPKPFGGGLGQVSDKVVFTDLAGLGYKQGLFAYDCSAGGVGWPQVLVLTGDGGKLLGSVDLKTVNHQKEHANVDTLTVSGGKVLMTWKEYDGASFEMVSHNSEVRWAAGKLTVVDTSAPPASSPTPTGGAHTGRPSPATLAAAQRRGAEAHGDHYPQSMYDCMGSALYKSKSTNAALWSFVDDPTTERDIPGLDNSGAQNAVMGCMMQSGGGST
ncbi:serine/threonine-protein kinase [Luteipulveratus mongoliensis]|uniref:serine/threonine-protein kinase n=1 Tax=Luteipulveratus mongoliensis TaxID=571913 RepID=UPI0006985623|nr:serine/threonine-protein kinase [Luteipulveratus mongoliensis]